MGFSVVAMAAAMTASAVEFDHPDATCRCGNPTTFCVNLATAKTFGASNTLPNTTLPELFGRNETIVFVGDSITHGGRGGDPNHYLGHGFASAIAMRYLAYQPDRGLQFFNRGRSGDASPQLLARWAGDVAPLIVSESALKDIFGWKTASLTTTPDVVSLLIGVNDQLRSGNYHTSPEQYEENLRALVEKTASANPKVRFVLCEPFRLPVDTSPEFTARQKAARRVARDCNLAFVPFQKLFSEKLLMLNPNPKYWYWDAFHPTFAAHQYMADFWIDTVAREFAAGKGAPRNFAPKATRTVKPGEATDLWSDRPTARWTDAYPIGNGVMAAMVFHDAPLTRLQFNRAGLCTQAPRFNETDKTRFFRETREKVLAGDRAGAVKPANWFMGGRFRQARYQPFGDLFVRFATPSSDVASVERRLSIRNGVASGTFTDKNDVCISQRTFAPYEAPDLIVHAIKASKPGALSCEVSLASPHTNTLFSARADTVCLDGQVEVEKGFTNAVRFAARARLLPRGRHAKLVVRGNVAVVTGADALEIRLAGMTNRRSWKELGGDPAADCEKILSRYAKTEATALLKPHIAHFRHCHDDLSKLTLPGDPKLATLTTLERLERQAKARDGAFAAQVYAFGKYLLVSSSRPGGDPANLQGIWNDQLRPPWDAKYTCNINIQMNYWPAEATGLVDCHEALFGVLPNLVETGRRTAKAYYGMNGWVLHHNFDCWMTTTPTDAPHFGLWPMGGAWFALHLWDHYRFRPDDTAFLRERAWPVMSEAARFFTEYLVRHPKTGRLVTCPSMSPEHGGIDAGPAMDMQIVRALYRAVLESAEILGRDGGDDAALVAKIRAQYPELQRDAVGKWGQLQEWIEDRDDPKDGHRHFSHLWAVYPGDEINWSTPETFDAAKVSLVARGDGATGWSMGWKINCWARFRDGDHAMKIMDKLFRPADRGGAGLYANLFDAHPPFQIDGNFGACAGIVEMLVQSHVRDEKGRPVIELLPALPTVWRAEGTFERVRARGGFTLSFAWRDGRVTKLDVTSESGVAAVLRMNGKTFDLPAKKGRVTPCGF